MQANHEGRDKNEQRGCIKTNRESKLNKGGQNNRTKNQPPTSSNTCFEMITPLNNWNEMMEVT